MILFVSIVTIMYVLLIVTLLISWERIPLFPLESDSEKETRISVIIAVRNEEKNILNLLNDFNQQDYPFRNFEVIVIDDFSTDETIKQIRSRIPELKFNLQLFTLPDFLIHSGNKKACIQKGIESSSGDFIVTTDGDCRVGKQWLSSIEYVYAGTKCKMITGPVTFSGSGSFFKKIQTVEFASLIGTGAASLHLGYPNMCNGANLAYEKKAFYEVNGFAGNEKVASGDDEFLMHKMHEKYPGKVLFLKNPKAIVTTEAQDTLKDFANQRSRWASKWGHYRLHSIKGLAFFIFLYNLTLLVTFILALSGAFPSVLFLEQLTMKMLLEFVFLKRVLGFFGKKSLFFPFLMLQMIYPFYVTFFALNSLSGKYEWKGRKLTTIKP